MRPLLKKVLAFLATITAGASLYAGTVLKDLYGKPGKKEFNEVYCASPLAKSLEERIDVSINIIVEESLAEKFQEIEEAFDLTKRLYQDEFNINLNPEFIIVPKIPEFNNYKELKLCQPEESKDTYIFIADHLNSINRGGSFIGMTYERSLIAIHHIKEKTMIDLSIIFSHEIGHLFYAEHLGPGFEHCVMYSGIGETSHKCNLVEMCPNSKEVIMKYRDRVW